MVCGEGDEYEYSECSEDGGGGIGREGLEAEKMPVFGLHDLGENESGDVGVQMYRTLVQGGSKVNRIEGKRIQIKVKKVTDSDSEDDDVSREASVVGEIQSENDGSIVDGQTGAQAINGDHESMEE
jgi:hypothetical protein